MKRLITFGVAGKAIHRRYIMPAILLVFFSLTLATTASAAELVTNGGFELPIVDNAVHPDGWSTYYGENGAGVCEANNEPECNDGTLIPGWNVFWTDLLIGPEILEPGRVEIQNNTVLDVPNAKSGQQKAELDSHHRIGSDDNNVTISQFLPTCGRSAYTLNYAWKSRTILPHDNDLRVALGDTIVRAHSLNTDWEVEEYNFVSDDSFTTPLTFASIGDSTTHGAFLDDVSVSGNLDGSPEPCDDPEPICELGKPQVLTLLYDGNEHSQHNQDSNEVIITDPTGPFPNPALINIYGHNKKKPELLTSLTLQWGETFDVSGPHKRIPPRMKFEITDPDTDEVIQTVQFHTSCSQPLEALDEFGGITVWGAKISEASTVTPVYDDNL